MSRIAPIHIVLQTGILILVLTNYADISLGDINIIKFTFHFGNGGCVSGEMQVEEQTKGIVSVTELSEGDVIRGIMGAEWKPTWCKVVAVFLVANGENRTTYDGFTADHMVIDHTIRPYGKRGEVRNGQIFTLATECDGAVSAAGQAFTPISTAFCSHELSWSEYLPLIAAIRRITSRTGNFWFDIDSYHNNESALVPHWVDQLPVLCDELLRCAREGKCQEFENVTEHFVHDHLNVKFVKVVDRAFPNMGGDTDKAQAGTVSEVVRPQGKGAIDVVLFSAIGGCVAVLLVLILAYRARKSMKTAAKEPQPVQPSANDGRYV